MFLLYAPRRVKCNSWRQGGHALGGGQATDHTQLRLASSRVVKTDELARGGLGLSHHLASRILLGGDG